MACRKEPETADRADLTPGAVRRWLCRALEPLFQRPHVEWHLPSGLAAHEQRHQEPTDALPLEVEGDCQVCSGAEEWFDRDVDNGPDRPVHTADAPLLRRIEADELRGDRLVASPMRRVVKQRSPTWGAPVLSM
jgi:hypothetical protein